MMKRMRPEDELRERMDKIRSRLAVSNDADERAAYRTEYITLNWVLNPE